MTLAEQRFRSRTFSVLTATTTCRRSRPNLEPRRSLELVLLAETGLLPASNGVRCLHRWPRPWASAAESAYANCSRLISKGDARAKSENVFLASADLAQRVVALPVRLVG